MRDLVRKSALRPERIIVGEVLDLILRERLYPDQGIACRTMRGSLLRWFRVPD